MIPSSQSDGAIYAHSSQNQDELDESRDNQLGPRSSSLNAMVSMHVEYSEDDEQIFDRRLDEDLIVSEETGAARIRDPPIRKTKINTSTEGASLTRTKFTNASTKASTSGVRGRRKLREATPDIDVE